MATSIVLIGLNVMLAFIAAIVLGRKWMRYLALGCAGAEILALTFLTKVWA